MNCIETCLECYACWFCSNVKFFTVEIYRLRRVANVCGIFINLIFCSFTHFYFEWFVKKITILKSLFLEFYRFNYFFSLPLSNHCAPLDGALVASSPASKSVWEPVSSHIPMLMLLKKQLLPWHSEELRLNNFWMLFRFNKWGCWLILRPPAVLTCIPCGNKRTMISIAFIAFLDLTLALVSMVVYYTTY